jgi:hypothetical protein
VLGDAYGVQSHPGRVIHQGEGIYLGTGRGDHGVHVYIHKHFLASLVFPGWPRATSRIFFHTRTSPSRKRDMAHQEKKHYWEGQRNLFMAVSCRAIYRRKKRNREGVSESSG